MPTYFQFLTLMAFHVFMKEEVDVAIMEVGIGGEHDSTNIIEKPTVCGVTSLGLDHQAVLGDTVDKIAWHKGGIFKYSRLKRNTPAVTVNQPESSLRVLKDRAEAVNAPFIKIETSTQELYSGINIGLAGRHQFINASLAVELCRIWLEKNRNIKHQVQKIPREFLAGLSKPIHWKACMEWFGETATKDDSERILVFNCTNNRNGPEILKRVVSGNFSHAIFCTNVTFSTYRFKPDLQNNTIKLDESLTWQKTLAESWSSLSSREENIEPSVGSSETHVFATIQESIDWITDHVKQSKHGVKVLVTGSLHLIGGVMSVFDYDIFEYFLNNHNIITIILKKNYLYTWISNSRQKQDLKWQQKILCE
ncbi:5123_t:CDS:10, partial [Acaulospora morrowiae]